MWEAIAANLIGSVEDQPNDLRPIPRYRVSDIGVELRIDDSECSVRVVRLWEMDLLIFRDTRFKFLGLV